MLFNSLEFLLFLAVVYALYRVLSFRKQNIMLLAASYLFYGWWDWRFLFLMILTTSVDFWSGLVIERGHLTRFQKLIPAAFLSAAGIFLVGFEVSAILATFTGAKSEAAFTSPLLPYVLLGIPIVLGTAGLFYRYVTTQPVERRRKLVVTASIIVQLSVLGFFKYFNFFSDSFAEAMGSLGFSVGRTTLDIILPVGISFYTFQSMSYAIDVYRRELKPTDRYFDFALFVSFFPQLVAGPIERAKNLLPQFTLPRSVTADQFRRGCFLIMFGLFKKVAIADGLAPTVDQAYAIPDPSWGTVVVGTIAFALQIYCDFSGYSDIARGVAKLFGIELMYNFNQPYFSRSPREFWQRWHISLSTWLSDYLYKPLGGNRGSLAFNCRNLMLTMILGGLWHGAAWNYVLWGFYHGTILSLHRIMLTIRGSAHDNAVMALAKMAGFGILTLYGWLLFRARSFDQVATMTSTLLTGHGGLAFEAARPALSALLGVIVLIAWEITQYRHAGDAKFYRAYPIPLVGLAVAVMVFLTLMGTSNEPAQFIYFQF